MQGLGVIVASLLPFAQAAPDGGSLSIASELPGESHVEPLVERPDAPPEGVSLVQWQMEGYASFAEAFAAHPPAGQEWELEDGAWGYAPPAALGDGAAPVPLMLLLHGLGQDNVRFGRAMRVLADAYGFAIVAPHSRAQTWDMLAGAPSTLGPLRKLRLDHSREDKDLPRVKAALRAMFGTVPVDARRIAVAGFSDGASYALTLGTGAPGLFSHTMVLSGGLAVMRDDAQGQGRKVFLSHGTKDAMLPYSEARDELVPKLQASGFDVHFRTFDGPHRLYYRIALEAVEDWLGAGRLARKAGGEPSGE